MPERRGESGPAEQPLRRNERLREHRQRRDHQLLFEPVGQPLVACRRTGRVAEPPLVAPFHGPAGLPGPLADRRGPAQDNFNTNIEFYKNLDTQLAHTTMITYHELYVVAQLDW